MVPGCVHPVLLNERIIGHLGRNLPGVKRDPSIPAQEIAQNQMSRTPRNPISSSKEDQQDCNDLFSGQALAGKLGVVVDDQQFGTLSVFISHLQLPPLSELPIPRVTEISSIALRNLSRDYK